MWFIDVSKNYNIFFALQTESFLNSLEKASKRVLAELAISLENLLFKIRHNSW